MWPVGFFSNPPMAQTTKANFFQTKDLSSHFIADTGLNKWQMQSLKRLQQHNPPHINPSAGHHFNHNNTPHTTGFMRLCHKAMLFRKGSWAHSFFFFFFLNVALSWQQLTIQLPCEVWDKCSAHAAALSRRAERKKDTCSDQAWMVLSICVIGWNEDHLLTVIQSSFTWKLCPVSEKEAHRERYHQPCSVKFLGGN